MQKESQINKLCLLGIVCFNLILWTALYTKLCLLNDGDYYAHNLIAELLIKGEFMVAYPGYHILVGGLHALTGLPTTYTAIPILTVAQLLSVWVVYKTILLLTDEQLGKTKALGIATVVRMIMPIMFTGYAPGFSSCNTYTSPTQKLVEPFIFLAIFFYFRERKRGFSTKDQIGVMLAILLTCFFKPMFPMAFIPAVGMTELYSVIKEREPKPICTLVTRLWPEFIGGLALIFQYWFSGTLHFDNALTAGVSGDTSIRIGFLHTWGHMVDNVWISILMVYLLPLLYYICNRTEMHHRIREAVIIYVILSFFMMAFLYQSGEAYEYAANFRNAWIYSFYLVYLLMLCDWAWKALIKREPMLSKRMLPATMLGGLQTLLGFFYIASKII